jgi:hypothetical protein
VLPIRVAEKIGESLIGAGIAHHKNKNDIYL